MFENAELGHKLDKETYQREEPALRASLLQAQHELASANFAVVVTVAGLEGAGKAETVNLLLEWLDPRGIQTHALEEPTDEERQRPPLWRHWLALPPTGRIGIFFGAWETGPFLDRVFKRLSRSDLDRVLERVIEFERLLANENTLLVKFWLHLSKRAQAKRFRKLEADPAQAWRVTRRDWKLHKRYGRVRSVAEDLLRRTSTAEAPWHIIEGADRRYRDLTVARTFLEALRARLDRHKNEPLRPPPEPITLRPPERNVLNTLDLTLSLGPEEYESQLHNAQGELNRLTRRLHDEGRSMILVFEGPDAAGKGGAIRRLTQAMDARDYRVISVAAPTDEERAHPYLWRFWRHLPRRGRVTLYDRSWYGRVLVERVEGFATTDEWQRAYSEINSFEEQLVDFGMILLKFYLVISPEEQLCRFRERQTTPYKQYKLTEEDWRNRAKWDAYEAAACDMIEKTSIELAPWVPVEANNKEWARVKIIKTIVNRLEKALST
jgi:polyphosphate:AMP phosphotransferase